MAFGTNQSILTLLKIQAGRYPNKVFLFFKEQEVTYRQLFERMEQVGNGLARFKIKPGDKVAICLPNLPESLFAFFGVLRRGAIAVPIGSDLKGEDIASRLNCSQSRVLITTARLYLSMRLLRQEIPHLEQLFLVGDRGGEGFVFSSLYISGPQKIETEVSPELPAVLNYSSVAKWELFTHQNLIADANAFVGAAELTEQDCFLYHPLSSVLGGKTGRVFCPGALAPLIVGGSVILLERFSPSGFFIAVQRFRVTAFWGGETMDKDLFLSEEAVKHDLSSLRFCVCQ